MPVVCDVPAFADFEKGFSDQINQLVTLTGVPDIYRESQVRSPIRKFMRRVFLCPGSERYHDAGPGGLVAHTLAVCRHVLENASQNPELNFKDRLALFVTALVHDVVRASHLDVTDVSPDGVPGRKRAKRWEPTYEKMARWVEDNGVTRVSMELSANREIYGLSEASAVVFILQIFNESYRLLIGQRREAAIIHKLTSKMPSPCIDLREYFKGADCIGVKRVVVGVTDKDVPLVWDALQREVLAQHKWNEDPYYFLASETHAMLTYTVNEPSQPAEKFWRGVHAIVYHNHEQDIDYSTTRQVVLDVIRPYLVTVCRTGDTIQDTLLKVVVGNDKRRRPCVAIPWDTILGRQQKRPRLDTPPPAIRIYPFKDDGKLVITPADLGFTGETGPEPASMIELAHITEIWRLQITPPFSRAEKKISDKILASGGMPPDEKINALVLLRMRASQPKEKES